MTRALVILLIVTGLAGQPALADHPSELDHLLRQIQDAQVRETAVRKQREQRFHAAQVDQKTLLEQIRAEVEAQRTRSEQLKAEFAQNEKELEALESQLQEKTGDFGELFGTVRQTAGDLQSRVRDSLVSAQYPGRSEWFGVLANSKRLPDVTELERFWLLIQQEIGASGQIVRFNHAVVGTDGVASEQTVTRIGVFNALSGDRYLRYQPESGKLIELTRQPAGRLRRMAEQFTQAKTGSAHMIAIDPTRGALLGLMVQMPDLRERIQQGGIVGYIIITLGIIGLFIVLQRLGYLTLLERRVNRQLRDPASPSTDNPLGRVLAVAGANPGRDLETLELQLDEAILRETPPINRGLAFIKLLAAVAPLLGLLGTVTGMIVTFQSISLFGTGDPKLMANGISQALVTTVLGLVVAIPLLFLHSLVATRARALIQVLDEQTAGLVASLWERR